MDLHDIVFVFHGTSYKKLIAASHVCSYSYSMVATGLASSPGPSLRLGRGLGTRLLPAGLKVLIRSKSMRYIAAKVTHGSHAIGCKYSQSG